MFFLSLTSTFCTIIRWKCWKPPFLGQPLTLGRFLFIFLYISHYDTKGKGFITLVQPSSLDMYSVEKKSLALMIMTSPWSVYLDAVKFFRNQIEWRQGAGRKSSQMKYRRIYLNWNETRDNRQCKEFVNITSCYPFFSIAKDFFNNQLGIK